mmetsp:Transcript_20469/g.44323  ORF Transcript_20469/g.44323 Transcript_20469/m.44323 type:complete len:720 (-) Transcript_20469:161-2320(-)
MKVSSTREEPFQCPAFRDKVLRHLQRADGKFRSPISLLGIYIAVTIILASYGSSIDPHIGLSGSLRQEGMERGCWLVSAVVFVSQVGVAWMTLLWCGVSVGEAASQRSDVWNTVADNMRLTSLVTSVVLVVLVVTPVWPTPFAPVEPLLVLWTFQCSAHLLVFLVLSALDTARHLRCYSRTSHSLLVIFPCAVFVRACSSFGGVFLPACTALCGLVSLLSMLESAAAVFPDLRCGIFRCREAAAKDHATSSSWLIKLLTVLSIGSISPLAIAGMYHVLRHGDTTLARPSVVGVVALVFLFCRDTLSRLFHFLRLILSGRPIFLYSHLAPCGWDAAKLPVLPGIGRVHGWGRAVLLAHPQGPARSFAGVLGKIAWMVTFFLISGMMEAAWAPKHEPLYWTTRTNTSLSHCSTTRCVEFVVTDHAADFAYPLHQPDKYPWCDLLHGGTGLTVADYALLTALPYLRQHDASVDMLLTHLFPTFESVPVSRSDSSPVVFHHLRDPSTRVSLIVIKGTTKKSLFDWVQNLDIWLESLLFQAGQNVLPFLGFWPEQVVSDMLRRVSFMEEYNRGNSHDTYPRHYYVPVQRYVTSLLEQERRRRDGRDTVVLVGHSLGGGLAKIVGARLKLPAVSLSGPGIVNLRQKIGVDRDDIASQIVNLLPSNDPVPLIGLQGGTILNFHCSGDAADCHDPVFVACELFHRCGHPRRRITCTTQLTNTSHMDT